MGHGPMVPRAALAGFGEPTEWDYGQAAHVPIESGRYLPMPIVSPVIR